jgi:hypothetical protein
MNFPVSNLNLKLNSIVKPSTYRSKLVKKIQAIDFSALLREDSVFCPASDAVQAMESSSSEEGPVI